MSLDRGIQLCSCHHGQHRRVSSPPSSPAPVPSAPPCWGDLSPPLTPGNPAVSSPLWFCIFPNVLYVESSSVWLCVAPWRHGSVACVSLGFLLSSTHHVADKCVHSSPHSETCGSFPVWENYKQSCYKHSSDRFCVNADFYFT